MCKPLVVTLAAATVVGGAGLAFGAIPSADQEITGCYVKKTGALRVIDAASSSCARTEETLVWNQRGPQGQTGPQGGKGEPGISEAFVDAPDTSYGMGAVGQNLTIKAARVVLPAGAYVADGKGYVINAGTALPEQDARGTVVCRLYAGWLPEPASYLDWAVMSVEAWRQGQPGSTPFSVHGAFEVPEGGNAELWVRCHLNIPSELQVNPALTLASVVLTATRVGRVVEQ